MTSSWKEPFEFPRACWCLSGINQTVVEARGLLLPKLKAPRDNSQPTPVRRPGDCPTVKELLETLDTTDERRAVIERSRLFGSPSANLTLSGST